MIENSDLKIIGKRVNKTNINWVEVDGFLKLVVELNKNNRFIPRGVFKFRTHQENDEWIRKVLTDR
jgi:hypothetical protein